MSLADPPIEDSEFALRDALWAELDDRVSALAGTRNAADAKLCDLFAEVLAVDGWRMDGIRSEKHWLTWQFGLTPVRAGQLHRIAKRWHDLPHAVRRFQRGELSFEQMSIIARRCPTGFDDDVATFAISATLRQLETCLRDYHFDFDTDTAPEPGPDDPAAPKNRVSRGFDDHGRYRLNADLDSVTGAAIDASIDHALDRLRSAAPTSAPASDPHGEEGTATATTVDALLDICNASLNADPSDSRRRRFEPVLHIDVDKLHERGASELSGTLHLGPALAKEMTALFLCDSAPAIVAHLDAVPLAKGRSTEKIPSALRQLIQHRDGGCRICGTTRNLHVHHIQHWLHGGPTDPGNLVTLCHRHHTLVHQNVIDVQGDPTRPRDLDALRVTTEGGIKHQPPRWKQPPPGTSGTATQPYYQHPLGEEFDRQWLLFNPNEPDQPGRSGAPPNLNEPKLSDARTARGWRCRAPTSVGGQFDGGRPVAEGVSEVAV